MSSAWAEVGEITVKPTDSVVEVGSFDLVEGADSLWVRMTNTGTPGGWPWSYGILSFKTEEGQPLGSIKAYNSYDGEVFRLGVGLAPSVRSGKLTFEPRGFNLAWVSKGNPWPLKFEAQSGGQVTTDNYWSRVPGTLAPSNADDGVSIGGEKIVLKSNGDANYKGLLTTGAVDLLSNAAGGVEIAQKEITVQRPGTDGSAATLFVGQNGTTRTFSVTRAGNGYFYGKVTASNVTLRSSNPQFQVLSPEGGFTYAGPELSLIDELYRLESLVKDLYEKLRLEPPSGWPVWDGSDDLVSSLGHPQDS